MAGSALKRATAAASSRWETSDGRCSWAETIPTSAQSACFMATYRALGPSSPTRMVPSPTVIPSPASLATRSVTSARILPARSSPSSKIAVIATLPVSARCRAASLQSRSPARTTTGSVPEVAFATGHDHGDAGLVGGGGHLVVADRAAGLHDGGHPGIGQYQQAVGEGEERVAGRRRPGGPLPGLGHGGL